MQTFFSTSMGAQIPVIAEKPLAACGCRKFQIEPLGDHLNTCTAHSGVKKAHDWMVAKFLTSFTQPIKQKRDRSLKVGVIIVGTSSYWDTLRMRRARCLWCWISVSPRPLGSSSDPSLNGHLHYSNDIDRSLNEVDVDKIRTEYRSDYNNNPPNTVSFMPDIPSTSGRLHSEFVRLLFLQTHRETDRFFAASGVQLAQTDRDQFHFRRAAFSSHLKSRVVLTLAKAAALRITFNLDGSSITSNYSPRIHWVTWGTGTPKERDEVKRREVIYECRSMLFIIQR